MASRRCGQARRLHEHLAEVRPWLDGGAREVGVEVREEAAAAFWNREKEKCGHWAAIFGIFCLFSDPGRCIRFLP
jgi:hypothetical protein